MADRVAPTFFWIRRGSVRRHHFEHVVRPGRGRGMVSVRLPDFIRNKVRRTHDRSPQLLGFGPVSALTCVPKQPQALLDAVNLTRW